MENQSQNGKVKIWIRDPKLGRPLFFFIDINNVLPEIKRIRVKFLRYWISSGPFRRKPYPYLFFEGPNDEWIYVCHWIPVSKNRWKNLKLKRELFSEPEKLIIAILFARKRCEDLWSEYNEECQLEQPSRKQPSLYLVNSGH